MQTKLTRGALSALVASMLAMPAWAAPLNDDAAIQLLQRVNDLEQELRTLRGDNEKLQNELSNLQKNQKEGFEQVDERMDKLKTPDETQPDNTADKPVDTADKPADKPADTTDKPDSADKSLKSDPSSFYSYGTGKTDDKNAGIEKAKADAASKPDEAKTGIAPADKTEASVADSKPTTDKALPDQDERSSYDHAFQTLLQDPKEAVPEFRTFLKEYPKSPLASSAQYWVGEALYAEKDFKAAIEEFLVVLKEHKDSDKAPDAALKLGYSFYELKEWDKARKTLEDVISFFPNNVETSKMAQERLDKMKTEGH